MGKCSMMGCSNKAIIKTKIKENIWVNYVWCKHHWENSIKGIEDKTKSGKALKIIRKIDRKLTARESVMF